MPHEKYDQKYEDHIQQLADLRLKNKNYKIFDYHARVIKREKFEINGMEESCLVIINAVGDCMVLTEDFERMLYTVNKQRFE